MKSVMVCEYCESDEVSIEAMCVWNIEQQEWVLDQSFPDSAYCQSCEESCRLKLEPIIKENANG